MGIFSFLDSVVKEYNAHALRKYPQFYREASMKGTHRLEREIQDNWDDIVNLSCSLYTDRGVWCIATAVAHYDKVGKKKSDLSDSWFSRTQQFFEALLELGLIDITPLEKQRKQEEKARKDNENRWQQLREAEAKKADEKAKAAAIKAQKDAEIAAQKAYEDAKIKMFMQYLSDVESNILFSHKVYAGFIETTSGFSAPQRKLTRDKYSRFINSMASLEFLEDGDDGASNCMWLINKQKKQAGAVIMSLVFSKYFDCKKIQTAIDDAQSEREETKWIKLQETIADMYAKVEGIINENVSRLETPEHDAITLNTPPEPVAIDFNIKNAAAEETDYRSFVNDRSIVGGATVKKIYNVSKVGNVAGAYVENGHMTVGADVLVTRKGRVIATDTIKGIQLNKEEMHRVYECDCGILLSKFMDFKKGDIIESLEEK